MAISVQHMFERRAPVKKTRQVWCITYYQLYKTSLPFDAFLEPSVRTTQTRLKSFGLDELLASDAVKVILRGVLEAGDFLLKE